MIKLSLIFIFIHLNAYCQISKTISVEFTKISTQKKSKEIVSGHLYQYAKKTAVIIKIPLNQWIFIEDNIALIYYPENKNAIRIKSQNPIILPFFNLIFRFDDDNIDLAKWGYTIDKNELHGDTLIVHWKPPKSAKKVLGEFIISLKDNRIVSTKSNAPGGKTLIKTYYNRYVKYDNQFFPLEMKSISYSENVITTESIIFNNPIFDNPIPNQISQFSLPDSIEIKEVEW